MRWLQRLFAASARVEQSAERTAVANPASNGEARRIATASDERDRLVAAAGVCDAAGRYAESLALLGPALAAAPDDPELLFARASTLFDWGRHREALADYLKAAALGLGRTALPLQIGWCWLQLGDAARAETWMRKAVQVDTESTRTHFGLATVLNARNRLDEALASYECALERESNHFQSLAASSRCLLALGDDAGAEVRARRAISEDRASALGWAQLSASLVRQRRFDEAIDALEHAESVDAGNDEDLNSFVSLAIEHNNAGRVRDALDALEPNLAHRPSAQGHYAYGLVLLGLGRLAEGWNYHEFRWLIEPGLSWRQSSPRPTWTGQSLRGRTILLRIEQGYGDAIQFLRYVPCVKALGATVVLQVYPGLMRLAADCPGVDRVIDTTAMPADFDFCAHLLSLPRVFGTELASIPAAVPYLRVDPARAAKWAARLPDDNVRKVGVVWASGPGLHLQDRDRSIPFATLTRVLAVDGVRFYALQKGPEAADIAGADVPDQALVDLGPELEDFADTAAVISRLDLVLSVDTSVAHLAGALGKPVWLMLKHAADFRWLDGREDSPWYPTMRLFRQRRRGDWEDVALDLKVALEQWARGDAAQLLLRGAPLALPGALAPTVRQWPPQGHRPGFSAAAEARAGILQYLPDEDDVGAAVHWYGEFLQGQLDLLARYIRPGMTVMEVGAGIGVHALALAGWVGPAGHTLLYEPRPVVRRILQQNLAANRVHNVTVMRRAVGPVDGAEISASSPVAPAPASTASGLRTETLDDLQLERLDWLKVNGGNTASSVLDGAAATLWRLRPRLFLAAEASTLSMLADRVREFGYRCWRVKTPLFNPDNFNRRDDDIFPGRLAWALLAIPEEIEDDVPLDRGVEPA